MEANNPTKAKNPTVEYAEIFEDLRICSILFLSDFAVKIVTK